MTAPLMPCAASCGGSATRRGATRRCWGAYSLETIRELKDRAEGDLYVNGSGTLVRAMLADGLVDRLHLFVYPLAVGTDQRLFAEGGPRLQLTLEETEAHGSGVLHLSYSPAA